MTTEQRIKSGEFIVPVYRDKNNKECLEPGDNYLFNWETYIVKEICRGDLEGYCWIGKA